MNGLPSQYSLPPGPGLTPLAARIRSASTGSYGKSGTLASAFGPGQTIPWAGLP